MTREEIIDGLKFTVEMFLSDPNTGETLAEPRNDMDKTIIDACKGAIELLGQEPIDKSAMMIEIYMQGVNMAGEYQGCWVRFKDIEKIVDKYITESGGKE